MLGWPWLTTGGRFRDACDENVRLRDQNDKLIDHLMRIDRVQNGLPEVARKSLPDLQPMPMRVLRWCNRADEPRVRARERDHLLKRHQNGESWDKIEQEIFGEDAEKEAFPTAGH